MSKKKTYNSLEDFAKEWKKENPTPKSEKKAKVKSRLKPLTVADPNDDRTDVIRIPV